ncbi:MAG: DNA polymerase III subunit delta [Ignavibacteriales bacterium]|nr:DNA polymerase III subunit delta [Ignavibacteriales bacterium]
MPEISLRDFQSRIERNQLSPIYLFHGEEDLLIEEGVEALIKNGVDPATKSFNLDVLYGSRTDAKSALAIASSFPMMSERRVVIIKEFEKLASGETAKELLSAYIQRPLETTCLVLISPDPDFRRKPFTDLKKHADVIECKPLYDNQVPAWILDRVRRQGRKIELDACQLLQAYAGNSLRAILNEIEKLFIFIGDRQSVTVEDVAQVVGATRGFTIFDLQNAIGRLDMKEALQILKRMLELGENHQLLIVMLTRFFHQLWKLSELTSKKLSEREMAAELKVHPFYLKQYLGFARNFSVDHIETGFKALLEADVELKSTSRDPHIVLDLLVYTLIRGSREGVRVSAA